MKSPLALFKLEKKKKEKENQVMKKILCLLSNKKKLHQIENNFTRS